MENEKSTGFTWIPEVFDGAVQHEVQKRVETFQKTCRCKAISMNISFVVILFLFLLTRNFAAASELHSDLLFEILRQIENAFLAFLLLFAVIVLLICD
jgi:hypothetical protein